MPNPDAMPPANTPSPVRPPCTLKDARTPLTAEDWARVIEEVNNQARYRKRGYMPEPAQSEPMPAASAEPQGVEEPPELTPGDEARLDAIWDKMK